MELCRRVRYVLKPRSVLGAPGGATGESGEGGAQVSTVWEYVEEVYWEPCGGSSIFGTSGFGSIFGGGTPRNGFDVKPGSQLPVPNLSDQICESESLYYVNFEQLFDPNIPSRECTEDERTLIREAIRELCLDNNKIIQRLSGLRGCSDAIDKLIDCLTSLPWHKAKFQCGSISKDGVIALKHPKSNHILIDLKKMKDEFSASHETGMKDLLKKSIFHELTHVCGYRINKNLDPNFYNDALYSFFDELDTWIVTYFAYGVENTTYLRESPKSKFKPLKIFTPELSYLKSQVKKEGYLYSYAVVESTTEGGSGPYSDLLNLFSDGKDENGIDHEYLWGGSFIWDVKTGNLYCWDFYKGLAGSFSTATKEGGRIPIKVPYRP